MKWLLVLLVACKSSDAPAPAPKPALGVAVEVRGAATLVTGTRRIALRTGTSWYVPERGKLVDKPELAAAIAKVERDAGGVVDVFLGTTPIVVGGEEHHEKHVRVTPKLFEIEIDGLAGEVVTHGFTDVVRYEHELRTHVAYVEGTTVTEPRAIERVGPDAPAASPVSERLCRHPKIVDLDAATIAYALVTECSDDAPLRVVELVGDPPTERRLPSRTELRGFRPDVIAVSRSGQVRLVGVRDAQLGSYRVERDAEVTIHMAKISRVVSAVVADDDSLWVLALDDNGYVLVRDGIAFPLATPSGVALAPKTLGLDDTLGVVVLATGNGATWLYAQRPGEPLTINPR